MVGWKLLVKWRDQSESWIKLSELKESHPVETAEFAKSRGIDDEPAFAWWVPHTLKKRNAIISAIKVRLRKTTHKYGIEMPTRSCNGNRQKERKYNVERRVGPGDVQRWSCIQNIGRRAEGASGVE